MDKEIFPKWVKDLPEADLSFIPFKGVRGWLLQGIDKQVVFYEIDSMVEIPEHSHGEQWGILIEGEMDLVVGGIKKVYRKGDYYLIPAGALHSVTIKNKLRAVDFFADAKFHRPKQR